MAALNAAREASYTDFLEPDWGPKQLVSADRKAATALLSSPSFPPDPVEPQ
jgi:hypothetical protein